ncbi:hypothetical protein NEFER03_1296 [Nematocida sp. LUAm3]|nr:hypothetical protein NEFER03_1296 [Nematocida sp. LUAm3]KAI5174082.1 hypothetical protein NEFER02_0549 [Nematocida sp. LUAm2]KAI5177175.1 hypothetical protein NEFER01_0450 [Nematocida sp. LUAm1]
MKIILSSPLKKTVFSRTKERIEALREHSLQSIMDFYQEEEEKREIIYVKSILKRKNILHLVLKKEVKRILENRSFNYTLYYNFYKKSLFDQSDLISVLEEVAEESPEKLFHEAKKNKDLLNILSVVNLDSSDLLSIVGKVLLFQNRERVLEYINEKKYSMTLKYLISDLKGMEMLIHSISSALTKNISNIKEIRKMIEQIITMYIDLSKIDFTLVLLAPIITYIRLPLIKKILSLGPDVGAEILFHTISKRLTEILGESNEQEESLQEDLIDYLLSLIPYDNILETLAFSISRDYILNRKNRYNFLQILERKIGIFRISNINIIKKDFLYFSGIKIEKKNILEDISKIINPNPTITLAKDLLLNSFVFSHYYWPENNYSSAEDLFSPEPELETPSPPQEFTPPHENIQELVLFDFSKCHTYVDITIESKGKEKRVTVPLIYLEYLNVSFSEDIPKELISSIEEFWKAFL